VPDPLRRGADGKRLADGYGDVGADEIMLTIMAEFMGALSDRRSR
tara:strand:- start:915 stop:1049 length:135 start_codon:yes stop_codon:yes gene_type:complete